MAENMITSEGLRELEERLAEMEGPGRREIADRILIARGWGDLSENAEYHAAKNDQAHHETAILKLRDRIQTAVVVDDLPSDGTVGFGSTVKFLDADSGREQTFTLVASHEASPSEGKLSAESPVAVALMGSAEGDEVKVSLPNGEKTFRILKVD
jgi:transcription elongation factor GreA